MKCIQCNTDSNLRDRTANQGRCKNCNHPFAFEPTTMGKLKFTDPFFAKVLDDISANNTLYFTAKQFLYLLDRRLKRKMFSWGNKIFVYIFFSIWTPGFFGGLLVGVFGSVVFYVILLLYNLGCIFYLFYLSNSPKSGSQTRKSSAFGMILLGIVICIVGGIILAQGFISLASYKIIVVSLIVLGSLALGLGIVQKSKADKIPNLFVMSATQAQDWLDQWIRANGEVTRMLPEPTTTLPLAVESSNQPPDVTAYSFDRLVVCDSDEIAQMLIANNFHFENNCAILSISGYPQRIFETIMTMVRRNSELQVFAFHDCSPAGMQVVHQLRTNQAWFAEGDAVIIDVGLLPRQIMATKKNMFVLNSDRFAQAARDLAPQIRQTLSEKELQWLDAGNIVKLESFIPRTLIRILQRSIASSQQINQADLNEADRDLLSVGDEEYGFIFVVDSFG